MESVAKMLSIKDEKEEEVWVLLQFYRDQAHADEVNANMMQDESIAALMKEFGDLISQGSNLIMEDSAALGCRRSLVNCDNYLSKCGGSDIASHV